MPLTVATAEPNERPFFDRHAFRSPARTSMMDTGSTDTATQRVFIGGGRERSRSADSRKSKENETMLMIPPLKTRKRKARRLEAGGTSPQEDGSVTIWDRKRRQKLFKFTPYTSEGRAKQRSRHQASSTDDDALVTPVELPTKCNRLQSRRTALKGGPSRGFEDIETLKKDIAELQKEIEVARKAAAEQSQIIEDLRRELAASKKMSRKQASQVQKLKVAGKKSDDALSSIQTSLQCQICLEFLYKPYALSPCGHILCQGCLQEWFKNAPRQVGEGEDHHMVPTLYRIKTCPCCRTEVYTRPIPVFLVKDLVTSFAADSQPDPPVTSDPASTADPWADFFPDMSLLTDEELDDSDEDPYDTDVDSDASSSVSRYAPWSFFSSADEDEVGEGDGIGDDTDVQSTVDDVDDDVRYVHPTWSPAFYRATLSRRNHPDLTAEHLQLIQRGMTPQMLARYEVRLDRHEGIVAWTESGVEAYLGWNIARPVGDHPDGRRFMAWVESDIISNPHRWRQDASVNHVRYRRLVPEDSPTEVLGLEDSDDESD